MWLSRASKLRKLPSAPAKHSLMIVIRCRFARRIHDARFNGSSPERNHDADVFCRAGNETPTNLRMLIGCAGWRSAHLLQE